MVGEEKRKEKKIRERRKKEGKKSRLINLFLFGILAVLEYNYF